MIAQSASYPGSNIILDNVNLRSTFIFEALKIKEIGNLLLFA